jgi:hypothetical protein
MVCRPAVPVTPHWPLVPNCDEPGDRPDPAILLDRGGWEMDLRLETRLDAYAPGRIGRVPAYPKNVPAANAGVDPEVRTLRA